MTKLSLHWRPEHVGQADLDAFAAWNPPVVKIVDGDATRWAQAYKACPNAQVYNYRDWALSCQWRDVEQNPEGAGYRHATELVAAASARMKGMPVERIALEGINEPPVWNPALKSANGTILPDTSGLQLTVRYEVSRLNRLSQLGWRGMAINLGVGWPANTGKDTPVNWTGFEPVHQAIINGKHYLGLHEYWDRRGPKFMWTWWAGRYLQCPWKDVQIVITECGLDQYVADGGLGDESRGWSTNGLSGEQYMSQLADYDSNLILDRRIIGATIFTYDFDKPWGSFNVQPLSTKLAAYAKLHPTTVVPSDPPPANMQPLPQDETCTDSHTLAQKVRWWMEEYTRQINANPSYAQAILNGLIDLKMGLMYRLENSLK